MNNIDKQLQKTFTEIFRDISGGDVKKASKQTVKSWDSLGQLSLIGAMEQDFGVTLTDDEATAIDSYSTALAIMTSKLTAGSSSAS